MNEDDAKAWLSDRFSPASIDRLTVYIALLTAASDTQNLVSQASINQIWARHIVDSAQLVPLAGKSGLWLDIGSGAGLPGIVISILTGDPVLMVEPRALRATFLSDVVAKLGLSARVFKSRIEAINAEPVAFITARAYAPLTQILGNAHRFSTRHTKWILPKGRLARSELESVIMTWHGTFHVEQSLTDPDAGIVVASSVQPRGKG